jgi:probable F420-dependent oxidoreductase
MRIGLFGINIGTACDPAIARRIGALAEEEGYDSLWAAEHVVLPDPQAPPSPMAPTDPILDPVIALTYLAACTTSVRLATGIVILPQRNPLVLAKQVASLDVLSGGRFDLGIGVGYLVPEFEAIGANFADRGAVADEFLDAMAALWHEEKPAYQGRFVSFAGIDAHPRPTRSDAPRIVIGGHHPPAFRRAVARGHGWYGFALDLDQAAEAVEALRSAAAAVPRPSGLGRLEISVTPSGRVDAEKAAAYAALGVDRLVLRPRPTLDEASLVAFVRDHAALAEI